MGAVIFSIPKELVEKIIQSVRIDAFVETGTFEGETCFWAADYFKKVYTIEIDPEIGKRASGKNNCPSNIEFLIGNSKDVLPRLSQYLDDNTFFWLDGHWCSGAGGKEEECPLIYEIKAISGLRSPTIFIDDARCFMGPLPSPHISAHWPKIDEIFSLLKNSFPEHSTTIQDDVIMCVPQEVKKIIDADWQEKFKKRFGPSKERGMEEISPVSLKKQIINKLTWLKK